MNVSTIVPANIQRQIDRVDRQHSLLIGISCGLVAFWSIYRVIWTVYLALTYDFLFGSLIFPVILWGVVGVAAAIASTAFLSHYAKSPASSGDTEIQQP
jgi:hypothetical protein